MKAKIGALVAAAAAAVATAGAAAWAKRKMDESESEPEVTAASSSPAPPASAVAADAPAESAATEAADGDDLTQIKGIGSVSLGRLEDVGVTSFAQIAAWSDEDLDSVAAQIKVSPERMRREDWVGQARVIVDA